MANKFQNVFSMADYKLHMKMEQLEKEKRQCMNRLKEEKHMFKMSVKLPHRKGESSYWNQYGEIFHANGDLIKEKEASSAGVPCSGRQHVKEWTDNILVIQPQKIYNRKDGSVQRWHSVNSKHTSCDTLVSRAIEESSAQRNRHLMKQSAQRRIQSAENPKRSSSESVCQLRKRFVIAKGKAVGETKGQKDSKEHISRLILQQNGSFENHFDDDKEVKKHLKVSLNEKCRKNSTLAATEAPVQAVGFGSKNRRERSGKPVVKSRSVSYGMKLAHDSRQARRPSPSERSREQHVGLSTDKFDSGSRRTWCKVGFRCTDGTKDSLEESGAAKGFHRTDCSISNEKSAVLDRDPEVVGFRSSGDIIAKEDPAQDNTEFFTRGNQKEMENPRETGGKLKSTASVTPVTLSLKHGFVGDEQGEGSKVLMVSRAAIHQRHLDAEKEDKRDTQAKINDFFQRLDGTKRRQGHFRSRARSCTLTRSENPERSSNSAKTNKGKQASAKGYRRASGWPVEIWS